MASVRVQCLNSTRRAVDVGRRTFSTSKVMHADDSPQRSATSALMSTLEGAPRSPRPSSSSRSVFRGPSSARSFPSSTNNAINIMGRNASRPGLTLQTLESVADAKAAEGLTRQIKRRWKEGDVYAPKDLSGVEMAKWKVQNKPTRDVFDILNIKPLEQYSNFAMMSEFMTPMGRIRHRNDTGLRGVNQRKIAKAIRRSIGIGMMPSVYRHPEIVRMTAERAANRGRSSGGNML